MRRIAITGTTGYIGLNIAMQELGRGSEVICIVNPKSSRISSLPEHPNVRVIECSMSEYFTLELDSSLQNCDIFYHLAWADTSGSGRDDAYSQLLNVRYTIDALHLAKRMGCGVFIGAGSQAEYGSVPYGTALSPDTPCNPTSGYGIAKLTASRLGLLTASQLGLRFNWIRILSIYGPGDSPTSLISYAVEELRQNRPPQLTKCEQTWDYLHVADAARAFIDVADRGKSNSIYCLGSGNGIPLSCYIDQIREICGATCDISFGARTYYPHQPMYLVADISALTRDVQFRPSVAFAEGIKSILNQ